MEVGLTDDTDADDESQLDQNLMHDLQLSEQETEEEVETCRRELANGRSWNDVQVDTGRRMTQRRLTLDNLETRRRALVEITNQVNPAVCP